MTKISAVKSISQSQRAQFRQSIQSKKTGQTSRQTKSSQPVKINKGKTTSPVIQQRRLKNAAFQQKIQTAIKSSPQRKAKIETSRTVKIGRLRSIVNPLSAKRTINRTSKLNSLISRSRFRIKNTGSVQSRPRIKSLGNSEARNQIKIPDSPQLSFKTGRINLLV